MTAETFGKIRTQACGSLFKIVLGNGRTVELSGEKSFLSVGIGKADYKMSRGSFKFSEKSLQKKELFITECREIGSGGALTLCDASGEAVMEITVTAQDERLLFIPKILSDNGFNRMYFKIPASEDEKVYGGGETFTEFNLRGQKLKVWVAEHINGMQTAKKIAKLVLGVQDPEKKQKFGNYETYYAQPTFMSSKKYFMHCDTTEFSEFDFTREDYHEITVNGICPVYFGFSDSFKGLMNNLSSLLGRQPELPDWVYDGAILGIQGGTDAVISKLDAVSKRNTAVAGVWCQDWEGRRVTAVGKQLQWNWEWDRELYPDLDKKIPELKEKGIRFLGYINPFLAVEKDLYKYASERGYCVKDRDGGDYLVKITTFPAAMVDLTNPEAYEWIKSVIKNNMISFGLDGWMADFGEYLPTDCVLYSGEDAESVHNTWPAIWARVNREAVEETGNSGRIMFFTRAGYTETIKYSTMMWAGDQHVDWSVDFGLPSVITAHLSLGVCGFGLSHSDVGGYTTFGKMKRSPELFMRWAEMNAFSPVMRTHEGLNPDLNAQFDADEQVLEHFAKYSRIHKRIKPYLKCAVRENAEGGMPVIRPLFFSYDEESAYTENTEYLLGNDILVAPVIKQGALERRVYLPRDEWLYLWDGREYGGGVFPFNAPLGRIPVFIRKKSEYRDMFLSLKNI